MKEENFVSLNSITEKEKLPHYREEVRRRIALASEIYKRRKELQLSQQELAKKVGATQSIISEIERADYNPGFGLLTRIGNALAFSAENWSEVHDFSLPSVAVIPLSATTNSKMEIAEDSENYEKINF